MDTIIDYIAKRSDYFGLSIISQDETDIQVMSVGPAMAWIDFHVEGEEISAKFSVVDSEMNLTSIGPDPENGEYHPILSIAEIERLLYPMMKFTTIDEIANGNPDVKAIWLGTGKWFIIQEIAACEDHVHILSKYGNQIALPLGMGIMIPYKQQVMVILMLTLRRAW